jgi:Na+-transporting methylmalonyl-CoA/oxaloacetate decarboxylase gamma subunit
MSEPLILALQVTGLGMSLVFAAILLLWLLMAGLVRLTAEPVPAEPVAPDAAAELAAIAPGDAPPDAAAGDVRARRRKAAALAVAVALAQANGARPAPALPTPPTANVSPWQAAMRANQLKQRGPTR